MLATYNDGLYVRKNKSIHKIHVSSNKFVETHCILDDSLGYLWITTNAGLYRFNKQNVYRKIEDSSFDLPFNYFGLEDGIKNLEFNGGCSPCANVLSNGNLSFPTIQGLVFVDPKTIASSSIPPRLLIQMFKDELTALLPLSVLIKKAVTEQTAL